MPVNLKPPVPAQLLPVAGVALGIAQAGIRKANRRDLTLIELAQGSRVAGVFTQNRFCAAPVIVAREHLSSEPAIRARRVVSRGRRPDCAAPRSRIGFWHPESRRRA